MRLTLFLFLIFGLSFSLISQNGKKMMREDIIENFDTGIVNFTSYPGQDNDPNAWNLDSNLTFNNSPYSLKIYGNTWKIESITPMEIDSGDVWQVSVYIDELGEIQGFGVKDSLHILLYAFAGTQQLEIEDWVPVYQGALQTNIWNIVKLPIADDWLSRFNYMPKVDGLVFLNDKDYDPNAIVYFDNVINITNDLSTPPQVDITFTTGEIYKNNFGEKSVDIQFTSTVFDPDSGTFNFYWYFGDDSTSNLQNPHHTYLVEDDHTYNVLLEVEDNDGLWGRATCQIDVDPGPSTFPVTINFVGDIMLARRYEQPGGIIPMQGVEAIFDPTLPYLGGAADITVANLECPFTNSGTPHPTKSVVFKSSPSNVSGLVYAGIDIVSLANNHTIDYGLAGLQQTQSVLEANNILYSGAGTNSYEAYLPVFYSKSGQNIAFLRSSDRTGQYNNAQPFLNAGYNKPGFANFIPHYLSQQINTVREDADLIIVEIHSGSEYSLSPFGNDNYSEIIDNPDEDEDYSPLLKVPKEGDIESRHFAIDAGADLVVCHHPHITQGFEVYNGKLIAHSLGNFVFELNYPETFYTVILNGKVNETGFYKYSITPIYIDDYIPLRAEGELGTYILDYLANRSRELSTYMIVDKNEVTADIILDTLTITASEESYEKNITLKDENGMWISEPLKMKRNGNISSVNSISPSGSWQYRLGKEIVWFGNFEDEGCSLWDINSNDEYFDTLAFRNERSLCQHRSAGFASINTNLEKRLELYSDSDNYTLYGYIRTENADNSTIKCRLYETRSYSYSLGDRTIGTTISGNSDWKFYYNNFTPITGTKYIDLRLESDGPVSGDGYSWFDDVGIIHWSDWKTFNPSDEIANPNDYYWLQIKTNNATTGADVVYKETKYDEISLKIDETEIINPKTVSLNQNYPNPFNPTTTISYYLSNKTMTILKIYNILGQEVRTMVNEVQQEGFKQIHWDGRDNYGKLLSTGVYIYRLLTSGQQQSKKMLLIR